MIKGEKEVEAPIEPSWVPQGCYILHNTRPNNTTDNLVTRSFKISIGTKQLGVRNKFIELHVYDSNLWQFSSKSNQCCIIWSTYPEKQQAQQLLSSPSSWLVSQGPWPTASCSHCPHAYSSGITPGDPHNILNSCSWLLP